MSLGAFLTDEKMGSWADEMEDMPVSDSRTSYGAPERRTYNSTTGTFGGSSMGGYSVREELPLPDKPPYTVHLGNLSFDATIGDVTDFFTGCECTNVRIIEDKLEMKPKGFGYAEFATLDGLKQALTLNGSQFQGRNIRISVADPPKDRDRPDAREFGDWSRKGPLPDLPTRGGDRRDRGGFGSDFGGERRERRDFDGDGKVRDFGDWTRKGPLSPLPQQERGPRDGGRPGTNDGPTAEGFRDRRTSPAQWGEGRTTQGSQDGGSRPPRREFQERPVVERTPTAAEQDNQWRAKMKPDQPPAKSPITSREGSEAPSSPALASAAPAGRPKLNLAKRTVSENPDQPAQPSAGGDAKANPFGAARPIDTAAKEREIEEKRLAALKEKKDAEEKAKEERKEAVKAAKAAEAEKQEGAEAEIPAEGEDVTNGEIAEGENQNGNVVDDKAAKPKEVLRDAKPKPSDAGAWRRPSGQGPPTAPRGDDIPRGPRGGRGGRGGGRGRYYDEGRGGRQNSNGRPPAPASQPAPAPAPEPEAAALEEDGWSTVSKPKKNNRGAPRAIAS